MAQTERSRRRPFFWFIASDSHRHWINCTILWSYQAENRLKQKHVDLSDTFCICALYPFRNTQHKRRQTCAHSEVVKFDHFEIRVMYQLSSAGKFNSVEVPQPVSQHHGGRLNSARNRRLDLCRQLQRHSSGVFHKSPHPYMHKALDWSADPATLVSRHTYTHGNIRLGPWLRHCVPKIHLRKEVRFVDAV